MQGWASWFQEWVRGLVEIGAILLGGEQGLMEMLGLAEAGCGLVLGNSDGVFGVFFFFFFLEEDRCGDLR